MITTINEWKKYINESEGKEKPLHNIFVPTRLDTRDMERAKQLTAQFYKQLESTPNEVTGELLADLLKFNPQFKLPDNLTVNGYLYLTGTLITSLPNNLTVKDGLYLNNTPITSLPDNLTVNDDLWLRDTPITSLPDNLIVKGYLRLSYTPIAKNKELLDEYKKKYKIII